MEAVGRRRVAHACGTTTGTARALVIDDYLFEGGENSQFHIVKLNRAYGADGLVQVDPAARVQHARAGTTSCWRDIGDNEVSIENSVAISGNTVYFANSGGLVQGWDIARPRPGAAADRGCSASGPATTPTRRSSSTSEGMLYVGVGVTSAAPPGPREVGQIMKLDPSAAGQPARVGDRTTRCDTGGGVWATPALYETS